MFAQWWGLILTDSTILFNTYDSNRKIIIQMRDRYYNTVNGLIHDSSRIIINRNINGEALDSTYQLYNGTQFESERFFLHYYPHTDTIHIYELSCISGICTDTFELEEYIYPGPGNTMYHNTYDYHLSSLSKYAYDANVYNNNGQIVLAYDHYNIPGEQSHSHRTFTYDANGNLISSYSRSSGHAGTYIFETFCEYSLMLDTSSVLNATVFLADAFSCQGEGSPAYILITGGSPPYSISWDDTTGISFPNSLQPIFFPDSLTTYVLHVADSLGQQVTKNIYVDGFFNHVQIASTGVCVGDTIFGIINPPLTSFTNYTLNNYDITFTSNDTAQFVIQPHYFGHLYITFESQCGVYANSDSVFIDQMATINLDADRYLCGSDSVVINPVYTGAITWFDGDTTIHRFFSNAGTYWATSVLNQCIAVDTVNINNTPYSISLGPDTIICTNHQITLDAGHGLFSYMWSDSSTMQNYSYSITIEDTMPVWVTAKDLHWCSHSDSLNIISVVCNDLSDFSENDIHLSPNPCGDYFTIKFPAWINDTEILLYNIIGELLLKENFSGNAHLQKMNYPPGVYFFNIISSTNEHMIKILHY